MFKVPYYKQHCENLKVIGQAITQIERTLNEWIIKNNELNIFIYTKILSHLINTWIETRLLKIIYEKNAFTDDEKERIIKTRSLKDKWKLALTLAFCKSYKMSETMSADLTTPVSPGARYQMLLELINNDLLQSYQIRNRIAHGQWKHAFNNNLLKINQDLTDKLLHEDIVKLQLKKNMFINLAKIIHDLAVSKPTFEKDFFRNYRKLEGQRKNYHNRTYAKHVKILLKNKQKYLDAKKLNKNNT